MQLSSVGSPALAHCHGRKLGNQRRLLGAPQLRTTCSALWSVDAVLVNLRKKRLEPKTVERVYEADVYPAVFDFAAWHQHRSRSRYLEHCITLFRSYFFRDLLGPLVVLVGATVAVGIYETSLQNGVLPSSLPSFKDVSDTPFQLTSFALSLMLVFRTNSSYSRWLDARQQWGLIVNTSRTFIRQVMTTLPDSSCGEIRDAAARWTIAFVRLSKLHLREHGDVRQEMQGLLHGEELPLVLAAPHGPLAACHVLSELLRSTEAAGQLSDQSRARLEADISMMSQALGACEKILRNPIPLSYTRHTSRFLILWLLWLPVALWGKVGWCVVPVEAIMTYLLLGIDEIAIQMEEPFGILPLENFCEAVQQSVEQISRMDHAVHNVVSSYACTIVPAAAAATAAVPASLGGAGSGRAVTASPATTGSGNGNYNGYNGTGRADGAAASVGISGKLMQPQSQPQQGAGQQQTVEEEPVPEQVPEPPQRPPVPVNLPSDRC